MKGKKNILIFVAHYLPGFKGGGPVRSIFNLVENLGDEYNFKIITSGRDFGDTKPYPNIQMNTWNIVGKATVLYISDNFSFLNLKKLINSIKYEIIYLNSYFSLNFTIKPLILNKLGLIRKVKIIIAPRGELSEGALIFKRYKKLIYLKLSKFSNLYKDLIWQASSKYEAFDIKHWNDDNIRVLIAPNLAFKVDKSRNNIPRKKKKGLLKIIFLSRISRKKNLDGAIKLLKNLVGDVSFNIYGPIEDQKYWKECLKLINILPSNINVNYHGTLSPEQVNNMFEKHDLFLFPTYGENYGHVIIEALCSGCPVLISDKTPWLKLKEKHVGWDCSLNNLHRFKEILQNCINMNDKDYKIISVNAKKYGFNISNSNHNIDQNRKLFSDGGLNVFDKKIY